MRAECRMSAYVCLLSPSTPRMPPSSLESPLSVFLVFRHFPSLGLHFLRCRLGQLLKLTPSMASFPARHRSCKSGRYFVVVRCERFPVVFSLTFT